MEMLVAGVGSAVRTTSPVDNHRLNLVLIQSGRKALIFSISPVINGTLSFPLLHMVRCQVKTLWKWNLIPLPSLRLRYLDVHLWTYWNGYMLASLLFSWHDLSKEVTGPRLHQNICQQVSPFYSCKPSLCGPTRRMWSIFIQQDRLWVVGLCISDHSPLTPDNKPQILLPRNHHYTKLCMLEAHRLSGHRRRDATVARFRSRFWTSHASKMSKNIWKSCQQCRLTQAKLMKQIMGMMPPERLMPSPPFTSVMVDYFGPYSVRG